MTQYDINQLKAAASLGLIPDEENCLFLFSNTHTDILVDILSGTIDAKQLARFELQCRGRNERGQFIGFQS